MSSVWNTPTTLVTGRRPPAKSVHARAAIARVDPPRHILHDFQVVQHGGDVTVTRGTIEFIYTDARPNLYLGYVRVHRLLDGGWQAITHRSFYLVDRV
jgi:hypothetical protein